MCQCVNNSDGIVLVLSSLQSSSPEHSFVEILHSDVPKHPSTQVKFHPYRRTSGCGHYAELARTIGSERRYFSNKHVEAFHNKISKSFEATAEISTKNPYVENLHLRLNKSGGKSQMPPTLARSPVAPAPRKNSPPVVRPPAAATPQESGKNEYVEAIHAKLQQMGRQPVAPSDQWWMTALEKVRPLDYYQLVSFMVRCEAYSSSCSPSLGIV